MDRHSPPARRRVPILRDTRGATAIEYALILALVTLVIVSAIAALGSTTGGLWNGVHVAVTGNGVDPR